MRGWLVRLLRRKAASPPEGRQGVALDETGVWRAAFEEARFLSETPRRLQEAQTQMVNHLGRAYQAHERQSRQYANLLQGVVQTVDLCEGLQPDNDAPATGEALAAVQRVLLDLLAGHGVLRWECAPGDPLGEGCEVVGIEERDDLPEHVIASVVAPGYRRPDGEVLRRPRVTISRAPAPTPAAEPEAAPPEQAPEPEIPSPEAAQEHENASDAGENREP